MSRWKQQHPSPATVVSVIALVVALAGTAMAGVANVSKLSKKDRRQVVKIANRAANKRITKRAPRLSVRHAKQADSAGNAQSLGGVTASSYVQQSAMAPVPESTLTLNPGWSSAAGEVFGFGPPRAYRDQLGVVHLAGFINRSNGTDPVALTLPAGMRPAYLTISPVACDTPGGLFFDPAPAFAQIAVDGGVRPIDGGTGSDCSLGFSLHGISFRAAG